MYRFWKVIIEPILECIKPKNIVEIGSDYGFNTKNLIDYCQQNEAILHVIDPLPKYNINEWEKEYHQRVVFHKELSLNVLWKLENIDVVLIDGDHNWYTVFNELKMIEKSAKKAGKQFPLVMLHDIGWPYGRRDLYYDPETIPVAYRKPYKRAGILLEHAVLAEQGGLNAHINNAVYENNQQNGVLTAVEDFLEGNTQQLQFIKIPGLYGLGIIYPDELLQLNPAFAEWTRELATSSLSWAISEEIEKARILTEVARQEKEREAREHKRQEAVLRQEVDALKDRLVNQEKELQVAKEASQKSLQTKERVEVALQEERKRLQAEVEAQRKITTDLERRLAAEEREKVTMRENNAQLQVEVETQRRLAQEHHRTLTKLRERLATQQLQEATAREEVEKHRKAAKMKTDEVYTLSQWIEQIRSDFEAMLGSWRWKVGDRAVRLTELAVLRQRVPMATDHLRSLFKNYDTWARQYLPLAQQQPYQHSEKKKR